jgi:hypothetical protein
MVEAFCGVFDIIEAELDRLREVTGIGAVRQAVTRPGQTVKIVREIMVFLQPWSERTASGSSRPMVPMRSVATENLSAGTRYPRHRV